MNNDELEAIRSRRSAITGGNWSAVISPCAPGEVRTDMTFANPHEPPTIAENMSHKDAIFLAHAPADIDALWKQLAFEIEQRLMRHTAWLEEVEKRESFERQVSKLRSWVDDLQSGMYVNCVYCGHRYGPQETTPVSMADALKAHIEQCPDHPMSQLKAEKEFLHQQLENLRLRYNERT